MLDVSEIIPINDVGMKRCRHESGKSQKSALYGWIAPKFP